MSCEKPTPTRDIYFPDVGMAINPAKRLCNRDPDALDGDELARILYGLVAECDAIVAQPTYIEVGRHVRIVFPSKALAIQFDCNDTTPLAWPEDVSELESLPASDEVLLITTRELEFEASVEVENRDWLHYIHLSYRVQWDEA